VVAREGGTELLLPEVGPGRGPRARTSVFYNPAMAADRDLAVAFARAWAGSAPPDRTGWEVTAATGVRGLRLLHESGVFREFLLTETNPSAFRVLELNVQRFPGAVAKFADGRRPPAGGPFDYVDVDPYGSPVPFLASAIPSVRPGGVLAVTATDMMVLAGVQRGASESRYGARPVRGRLAPEGGLRILLAHLARTARRAGRRVEPLLAYAKDHYVRAYLRLPPTSEGDPADPIGPIDPATWDGPEVGDRGPYGPLWLGPLGSPELVRTLRVPPGAERPRELAGFLERLQEEAGIDRPFYYEPNRLASVLGLPFPPAVPALRDALRAHGYRAGRTHARPEGIRTDAPRRDVEAIARSLGPQSQNARVRA
jgi:tRNA (guanine26-N2/guanine27-N2)-dimethyltransferase